MLGRIIAIADSDTLSHEEAARLCQLDKMTQYVWMEFNEDGKLTSSTPITLEQDGGVKWNENWYVSGHWQYVHEDGVGVMALEFHAGRGTWKRHLMMQVDEGKFRLVGKDNGIYKSDALWTTWSQPHRNTKVVGTTRIDEHSFLVSSVSDKCVRRPR